MSIVEKVLEKIAKSFGRRAAKTAEVLADEALGGWVGHRPTSARKATDTSIAREVSRAYWCSPHPMRLTNYNAKKREEAVGTGGDGLLLL